MSFPPLSTAELRTRLDDSDNERWSDSQLQHFLDMAAEYWNPRVDQRKFPGAEESYLGGIYGSAVKLASVYAVGQLATDITGGFDTSYTVNSAFYRPFAGFMQPCLKSGGVVVG